MELYNIPVLWLVIWHPLTAPSRWTNLASFNKIAIVFLNRVMKSIRKKSRGLYTCIAAMELNNWQWIIRHECWKWIKSYSFQQKNSNLIPLKYGFRVQNTSVSIQTPSISYRTFLSSKLFIWWMLHANTLLRLTGYYKTISRYVHYECIYNNKNGNSERTTRGHPKSQSNDSIPREPLASGINLPPVITIKRFNS